MGGIVVGVILTGLAIPQNKLVFCYAIAISTLIIWFYIERHYRLNTIADLLTIDPLWQESQQSVWHHATIQGKKFYELKTALRIRFNNSDNHQRVIKMADLVLLKPRHWPFRAKKITESYFVTIQEDGGSIERFDPSGPGFTVPAHENTKYMYIQFASKLPLGVSTLRNYIARIRFEVMGTKEKRLDMLVNCPRPNEFMNYNPDAKPSAPDTSPSWTEAGE